MTYSFAPGGSGEKRPPTMFALLEVEQQAARQCIRIALDVELHSGSLKERMTVVIEVVELG